MKAAASSSVAFALALFAVGCFSTGDDVVGVAGYTRDPTNGVMMTRWVFPVYQWNRHSSDTPSAKTYLLAGLGGWRRNRFDELAGVWVHPFWYSDRITVANRSSNSVTRATSTRAGLLVGVENVRTSALDPAAPRDVDRSEVVLDEETSVSVIPGFTWRSRNGAEPRVSAFWGLYRNDAEKRALEEERLEREARERAEREARKAKAGKRAAEAPPGGAG